MNLRAQFGTAAFAVLVCATWGGAGAQTNSAAGPAGSLLDQPPAPPVIALAEGQLTIQAANSSLRAILTDLQTRTGTTIEGLSRDERIFGVYGPGTPQAVLSALLDDSGYNVIIAGRKPDGAPREIVLSTPAATAPSAGPATQAALENDDSDAAENVPSPQPALNNAGPQTGNGGSTPPPGQIRTPQQMLEELQRMRANAQSQSGNSQPQ